MVTRVGTNRFINRWENVPHSTGEHAPQYRGTCPTIRGNVPHNTGERAPQYWGTCPFKEHTGDLDDAVLNSQKFPLRVEGSVAS